MAAQTIPTAETCTGVLRQPVTGGHTVTCVRTDAHDCDRDRPVPALPWFVDNGTDAAALAAALTAAGVTTPLDVDDDAGFHDVGPVAVVITVREDPHGRLTEEDAAEGTGVLAMEVEYHEADGTPRHHIALSFAETAETIGRVLPGAYAWAAARPTS